MNIKGKEHCKPQKLIGGNDLQSIAVSETSVSHIRPMPV